MNKQLFKHLTFVSLLLSVSACATSKPNPDSLTPASPSAPNAIGAAPLGERVPITSSAEFDAAEVIVTSEYVAASGRVCRRLQLSDGSMVARVVCKDQAGNWDWARDLLSKGGRHMSSRTAGSNALVQRQAVELGSAMATTEDSVADDLVVDDASVSTTASSELPDDDLIVDDAPLRTIAQDGEQTLAINLLPSVVTHEVLTNETLWSFAKRTTGNALNWQSIAEINDIDDARTIAGGDVLQVPAELARDGG